MLSIPLINQASLSIKSHFSNLFQLPWGHGIQCNDTQNNGILYGLVTKDQSAEKSKRQKLELGVESAKIVEVNEIIVRSNQRE